MKYLSSVMFAVCFVLFVLFTENFMVSINSKIMFWDHMNSVLNREAFMTILGWGIALIFIVFLTYTLTVAAILALSFAKPKIVLEVRLNSIASAHLLVIYAIYSPKLALQTSTVSGDNNPPNKLAQYRISFLFISDF